jgi:hypothetical protein
MIRLDVRFDDAGLRALDALPERIPWALQRLLAREAEEAARFMKQTLADQGAAATSLLINSVRADQIGPLEWRVGPHLAYARYVLEGRKPGGKLPPWRAIQDWMKSKRLGGDRASAWAIARAIQRRGIKPRDYLTPVADRVAARLADQGITAIHAAVVGG